MPKRTFLKSDPVTHFQERLDEVRDELDDLLHDRVAELQEEFEETIRHRVADLQNELERLVCPPSQPEPVLTPSVAELQTSLEVLEEDLRSFTDAFQYLAITVKRVSDEIKAVVK